jgi:hypothetical protein
LDMQVVRRLASILVLSAVVVCVTSCEKSRPGTLEFVGDGGSGPGQEAPRCLVIVTHGWIEKGRGAWPEDMARRIHEQVDPNLWVCGYFDWAEGAETVNPTDAARHARDVAGPKLAEEIGKVRGDWRHVHLIGHSCGCWAVGEAAKILAAKTKPDIHLTFLDAYVPGSWEEKSLGDVNAPADVNCWVEHYYTRDLTLGWTQRDLSFAHNVDITRIDGVLRDHNFPWQWYCATIGGEGPEGKRERASAHVGIEYGFARSRECSGSQGWQISCRLPTGEEAVKLKKE